jgi:two-component system nitrate/nitrite response regulator NarL
VELWASDGDVVTCEQAAAARSLLTIEPILTTRDKEVRPDGTARGAIEPPQRVLVVDGDPESRAALSSALNRAGYEAEQVTTGEEALEAAHRQRPAIVIMETHLGGASGYEICREFREQYGADEYLAKPIQFDHLLARVRRLMAQSSPAPPMQSLLTPREQEVLSLLEEGLTPEEMASRLVVTPKTVAKHIEHILGKLGVHSRAQAVALALRRGPQRPS